MAHYKKTSIGVEYPIGRKSHGYFDTTFDTNSNISSCIRMFFSTIRGERRMNPNYGTSIWNYIFENSESIDESSVKDIISNEISLYFPEIVLHSVILNKNIKSPDIYTIEIQLKFYTSKSSNDLQTIRFSNEV